MSIYIYIYIYIANKSCDDEIIDKNTEYTKRLGF